MVPVPLPAGALPPPRAAVLAAAPALTRAVGGRFSTQDVDRLAYARDLWPLALLWIRQGLTPPPPDAVAWPGSEAEVVAVVRAAREAKVALIPFGAGSGVCGGTWAVRGGVAVALTRLDDLGEVDQDALEVEVGAGVMGETLERVLNARGYTLGHFPSSIRMSTVGGWLAARSAGQFSSKYGKIEDLVVSLRMVSGAGAVVETPRRPCVGPDLAALLIGAEGTLGLITSARLRIFPRPRGRAFHGFDFASVEKGLEAIRLLFREGLRPAVVRLYDPFDTAFVGKHGQAGRAARPPVARVGPERTLVPRALQALSRHTLGHPRVMNQLQRAFTRSRLVLMFEGEPGRAEAEDRAATVLCRSLDGEDLGPAPGREWLEKRYDVSFRMSRLIEAGTFADTMEVSAPWERVLEVYERVHRAASAHAFVLCHFSHAYADGCSLYFSFVGSGPNEAAMQARYERLWLDALSAARQAGANVSHHHGVGLLKARALQESLGEGTRALAALKGVFDPDGLMNPGKLLP